MRRIQNSRATILGPARMIMKTVTIRARMVPAAMPAVCTRAARVMSGACIRMRRGLSWASCSRLPRAITADMAWAMMRMRAVMRLRAMRVDFRLGLNRERAISRVGSSLRL